MAAGYLFADPQVKPLSAAGQFQSGCYYLFFLTGSLTPANVYQDGACTIPLTQVPASAQPSCTADSAGRFNPIYLIPTTTYRVQLFNAAGTKLEDVDPYNLPGVALPSGSNKQVQYNNNGVMGGSAMTYDPATGAVTIPAPSGAVTALTLTGKPGTSAVTANGAAETPFVAATPSGTTVAIDCSLSNTFFTQCGAANLSTITISNPSDGQTINWVIKQDGVGSRLATWPAAFKWPAGAVGALSTAANAVDLLVGTYNAGLSIWLVSLTKGFA